MKRQKQTFNDLVRRYNKYRNKLIRLRENGKNEHRQSVLRKHIERLYTKLQGLQLNFKRKAVMAASVVAVIAVGSQNANAQIEFDVPVIDPFSISFSDNESRPTLGDLDGDGDLDLLAGSVSSAYYYFENTGTNLNPVYGPEQLNPFSLVTNGRSPHFVDMDDDGDLDIISASSAPSSTYIYFENIGTSSTPNYASPQINPFSLTNGGGRHPTMIDLDDDGDLDLLLGANVGDLIYFENIGTASSPSFGAEQINPFSLTNIGGDPVPTFADLDNDGDFDLIVGDYYTDYQFFENTGSASAPSFAAMQTNPFMLTPSGATYEASPAFADLDADGDMDLIVGSISGNFSYYENITDCTLDTSVNQVGTTLSAVNEVATYQWVDCDNGFTFIPGETGQSYTATANGNYALVISNGGCSDTSACYPITTVGTFENKFDEVTIHPNPTFNQLTIDIEDPIKEVIVFDMYGSMVLRTSSNSFSVEALSEGIYIINISTERGMVKSRFVKR